MSSIARSQQLTPSYSRAAGWRSLSRHDKMGFVWAAFLIAHLPLALLISYSGIFATAHALITMAVGCWCAVSSRKSLVRTAYAGAYITGAEVLWRMTHAQVFWEYGKYGIALIFILAILRNGKFKGSLLPIIYFALLLPSCALILMQLDISRARDALSFNLTGPFALMVCGFFFSKLELSRRELQKLLFFCASPAMGIAGLALYGIRTNSELRFTSTASNFATSGGFGPNQVSIVLGLGAMAVFFFLVIGGGRGYVRLMMFAVMLFLAVQSALTFSRGGIYSAGGSVALASLYLIKDRRTRAIYIPLILAVISITYFILLPRLDDFTQGKLSVRFQNTDSTNRYDIAMAQLEVWKENPILGIGPGQARAFAGNIAHTEITRLLAEHGSFGLLALILLMVMAVTNLKRARTDLNRAFGIAVAVWAVLFMLNAGMRIAAPSFLFGLSFLTLADRGDGRLKLIYQRMKRGNTRNKKASRSISTRLEDVRNRGRRTISDLK